MPKEEGGLSRELSEKRGELSLYGQSKVPLTVTLNLNE